MYIVYLTFSPLKIHPCTCLEASDNGFSIECTNINLASLSVALASLNNDKLPIDKLLIDQSHFGIKY